MARGSLRRKAFDSTLGFPGEGPDKYKDVCIRTANVTSWNTFKRCFDEDDFGQCDVICLQEHRLPDSQRIEQAKRWIATKGYVGSFTLARKTRKGGVSSGTAILWKPFLHVSPKEVNGLDFRATLVSVRIPKLGDLWIMCLYGDVQSGNTARDQLLKAWEHLKDNEFWAIVGDFNMEAQEVRGWMSVVSPGAFTLDAGPT